MSREVEVDFTLMLKRYRAGWTAKKIAKEQGCGKTTIIDRLKKIKEPLRYGGFKKGGPIIRVTRHIDPNSAKGRMKIKRAAVEAKAIKITAAFLDWYDQNKSSGNLKNAEAKEFIKMLLANNLRIMAKNNRSRR